MSIINSILSMTVVGFKDQKSKWYSPLFTCHARWFHQCMLLWNNVQLFLIDRTGWIWFCEPGIPPTVIILTHSKVVHSYNTGSSQGLKIQGGARSNVVGIMCPPVEIGLTDLPKIGVTHAPLPPRLRQPCNLYIDGTNTGPSEPESLPPPRFYQISKWGRL